MQISIISPLAIVNGDYDYVVVVVVVDAVDVADVKDVDNWHAAWWW